MNNAWASLKSYLPPSRTSRHRTVVAGGALLLLAGLAWGLWALLFPQKMDYSKLWLSVEFTTDNQAHPVHLTLPDGKEGMFDILMIENLSDKPLSLLAFSSRPRISGIPADQVMTTWAQWIATSRQGIVVRPRSTWVLDPGDLGRLPAFHGHTWISVFFSDAHPAIVGGLPATILPAGFHGRFRVYYCLSQISEGQLAAPQLHSQDLMRLLQHEADATNKATTASVPHDVRADTGLTSDELH